MNKQTLAAFLALASDVERSKFLASLSEVHRPRSYAEICSLARQNWKDRVRYGRKQNPAGKWAKK